MQTFTPNLTVSPSLTYQSQEEISLPLCTRCTEEMINENCTHTDDERCLIGTYTHVELRKAVELGYKLKKVYTIWHWSEWTNSIFKPYVQKFFKVKEEVSTCCNN